MADSVQDVLQAFARGELVVVTDDDDREGEGDLMVGASLCTPKKMAFIIRHTSGIVCAPITPDDARRLRLDPMVGHKDSAHTTAFPFSIDDNASGGPGIPARGTSARGSRVTAAGSCVPAIPRPRSISASSPGCRRSASSPN